MDKRVRIGDLEINLSSLEVRDGDEVRKLEPRAAAVLECLLDQPDEVVSREALIASVWGHPYVSKDALAVTIHRLRQALGQRDDKGPVDTLPRRGYRLIMPATAGEDNCSPRRRSLTAIAVMVLVAVCLTVALIWFREPPGLPPDGPEATLLRAEALWNRREPGEARRALALAESALATGEVDARAHALLGRFYGYKTAHWLGLDRKEAAARGRRHLERALELSAGDPEVLTSAAGFALHTERDPGRARGLAEDALAADAGHVAARQALALSAAALGDAEIAVGTILEAARLAPTDGGVQWDRAFILFLAGRHEESLGALETATSLSPRDPYWLEALNLHAMGRQARAAEAWAGMLKERDCPVALTEDVRESFQALVEAAKSCEASLPFHYGLWSHYAGNVPAARGYFATARAEEDIMFLWQALFPLPILLPEETLASG